MFQAPHQHQQLPLQLGFRKACFPAQALLQRLQRVLPQQAHKAGESQINFVFRPTVCLCMCMHFCLEDCGALDFFIYLLNYLQAKNWFQKEVIMHVWGGKVSS